MGAIAEQPLRAGIPTGHAPGGVEHKDRIVLHALHEHPEPLLALLQCLLVALAFADVAEGQHNAGNVSCIVADGRGAVVDRRLGALP